MLTRREILTFTVTAGVASAAMPTLTRSAPDVPSGIPVVDTNISLFHWPFRRLPHDTPDLLVQKLRSLGIVQGWAASFEGILHRDITGVNQRLADVCREWAELIPIGSINPALPDWERDLQRCISEHNMPGVRLYPSYHGYTLDDPRFVRLLQLAARAGRFIQIAVAMEDPRTQNTLLRVPDVDPGPLMKLMPVIEGARVQILNHNLRPQLLQQFGNTPGVFFDTARVEGTDGIPHLVKNVAFDRVLFGSHTPFLIPEASLIRVHESDILDDASLVRVLSDNASLLLAEK